MWKPYRLIHLDYDDGKIFDIKEMSEFEVYSGNANLLGSGSRKRWEPASADDRVNVPKHRRRFNSGEK